MMSDTVTTGTVRERMLSLKGIIFALLIFPFCTTSALAALPEMPRQIESVDATIDKALHGLYSLDFAEAEVMFLSLTEREPNNPRLWNFLASSIWLKVIYEQEKLNLESFSGSRLGGARSNDLVSDEREGRLREVLAHAISVAGAKLEVDPDNIDALYATGVAYLTLASFEATVKRSYFAANRAASRAREAHLRVLTLDPSFNDARLTIGAIDYAVGVLPSVVRMIIGVLGISGDKEGGIKQLQYAAELGENNGTNAKMILVVVYNRERKYDESLSVLADLHSMYPRNFLLEISSAYVFQRLEDWDAAVRVYEAVLEKVDTGKDGYERLKSESVLFKIGEAHIKRRDADAAMAAFQEILEIQDSTEELQARSHLWLGKIFDTQDQRDRALSAYETVLTLDAHRDIHAEANRHVRRPFDDE